MNPNVKTSQLVALVGTIDPDAYTAGATSSGWISAAGSESFMATVMAGTLGTSATLDAKLEQATDSGGTGVKDISGKAITQLTQAGGDSDKQSVINLKVAEMDAENSFTHFRLTMTVAVATSDAGAIIHSSIFRHGDGAENASATVLEVV